MKNWIKQNWVLIIVVALLFSTCTYNYNQLKLERKHNSDLIHKVENYKLKDGTIIASTTVTEISENRIKDIIKNSPVKTKQVAKKFHKVKEISSIEQKIVIDSIYVPFKDTTDIVKIGEKIDSNFSFKYNISNKDFTITDLKIADTLTIIKGVKRKWFLGKETYTVDYLHSNKFIVSEKASVIEIKPIKHWYQNKFLWFALGAITTTIIIR